MIEHHKQHEMCCAVMRLKSRARKEIIKATPEWKQLNLLADALIDLCETLQNEGILTSANYPASCTSIVDAWGKIKSIRDRSNEAERTIHID